MPARGQVVLLAVGTALFSIVSVLVQSPGLGGGDPMGLRLAVAGCALVAFVAVLVARGSFHPGDGAGMTWGMLSVAAAAYFLGDVARIAEVAGVLPRTDSLGTAEVLWLGGMVVMAISLYGNMLHLNVVLGGRGLITAIGFAIAAGVVIAVGAVWPLTSAGSAALAMGRIPDALYLSLSAVIAVPALVVPLQMGRGEISSVWLVFSLSLLAMALGDYLSDSALSMAVDYSRMGAEVYMLGYLGMGAAAAVQWGLNGAPIRLRRGISVGVGSAGSLRRRSGRGAPGRAR